MTEPSIRYRLANDADTAMLTSLGEQQAPVGFPTVVAERGDAIVGYFGTHDRDDQVIAGPLVVLSEGLSRGSIALNLAEAYERVLRAGGVSWYRCTVADDNSAWLRVMQRLPAFEYEGLVDGYHVFKRVLQ